MSAARTLARAEAAGVRLRMSHNGAVRMEATVMPPPDMLADLRRWRVKVAHLLAARSRAALYIRAQAEALAALALHDPELEAERAMLALPFVETAEPNASAPGQTDTLRDGLLASSKSHMGQ